MSVLQLRACVKTYDWGVVGDDSQVAQFALASPPFQVEKSTPYAELWMGTHPSGPSAVLATGVDLKQYLSDHPDQLGLAVSERFGDLPFLFKVLAIKKALSIQAHPDKKLAQRLHRERPDVYKDSNHKPEMAIAITPFRGFCGFLPPQDISSFLDVVAELGLVIDPEAIATMRYALSCASTSPQAGGDDPMKTSIKALFGSIMTAHPEKVEKAISAIVHRYRTGHVSEKEQPIKELFLDLNSQFPGDVGVLAVYMLNVVSLDVGQAVFLRANEPHAYISGDIIETMAASDNVVRAGLTSKLRDVDTLLSMLTYSYDPASERLLEAQTFRGTKHSTLYDPPIDEFSVIMTRLPPGEDELHDGIAGPSILIVVDGVGGKIESNGLEKGYHRIAARGEVFFVGANVPIQFTAEPDHPLVIYRAFVEA